MKRFDLHIKVLIDADDSDEATRLAAEICRMLEKAYGVRKAELSSLHQSE
jgi:hypothetical protein